MLPVVTTKLKEHKFLYVSLIDKLLIGEELLEFIKIFF